MTFHVPKRMTRLVPGAPLPEVFTTGMIANICQVAPRTVSKWIDNGTLRGYRIPGSLDRRVPRGVFLRFLRDHGFPVDCLGLYNDVVVLVGIASSAQSDLAVAAAAQAKVVVEMHNTFSAGVRLTEIRPRALVVDLSNVGDPATTVAIFELVHKRHTGAHAVAVIAEDADDEAAFLRTLGATEIHRRPIDLCRLVGNLVDRIVTDPSFGHRRMVDAPPSDVPATVPA